MDCLTLGDLQPSFCFAWSEGCAQVVCCGGAEKRANIAAPSLLRCHANIEVVRRAIGRPCIRGDKKAKIGRRRRSAATCCAEWRLHVLLLHLAVDAPAKRAGPGVLLAFELRSGAVSVRQRRRSRRSGRS